MRQSEVREKTQFSPIPKNNVAVQCGTRSVGSFLAPINQSVKGSRPCDNGNSIAQEHPFTSTNSSNMICKCQLMPCLRDVRSISY
jgi:hypothetical protein